MREDGTVDIEMYVTTHDLGAFVSGYGDVPLSQTEFKVRIWLALRRSRKTSVEAQNLI